MLLSELTTTWRAVGETSGRNAKIDHIASLLGRAKAGEVPLSVAYLSGTLPQGRIGVGYAAIREVFGATTAAEKPSLTLAEVDAAFTAIAAISGKGSKARREGALGELFGAATDEERQFLSGLLLGELRQGALEGLMVEAIAQASGAPATLVRRALMFTGDITTVATQAMEGGAEALKGYGLELFRPLQPMLASPADTLPDAMATLSCGEDGGRAASFEWKLDGARVQVHRAGGEVRVFSRQLNDVTASVPEVVEAALAMPVDEIVLDGEVLAFRPDQRPESFQTTMRRFGRSDDVEAMRRELPLRPFFFDCLYLDGETLIDEPASRRWEALAEAVPAEQVVPRLVSADPDEAGAFLRTALAAGHEGLMAKDCASTYEAGRRGKSWLKLKPVHTLDLVILAAEWGSGRRHGWLSNLHLGARDADGELGEPGGFVMLGKTFKGLTDAMLEWQTERLRALAVDDGGRKGRVVGVRPELVVEIAFDSVQTSPRYPAGLALRFARVKAHRPDKSPADADTLATVRAIHAGLFTPTRSIERLVTGEG